MNIEYALHDIESNDKSIKKEIELALEYPIKQISVLPQHIKTVKKNERKNIAEKLKKSNQVLIQKNLELVIVPNVKDKSVREAIELLKKRGIRTEIKGFGKIISQSLEPGIKVPKNSICKLEAHI